MLMAWGRRKHPSRSKGWIYKRYFLKLGRRLVFGVKVSTKKKKYLIYIKPHSEYPIIRHVKVKGNRSTYDGDQAYWAKRILANAKAYASKLRYKLLKEQRGRCNWCQAALNPEEIWEIDHIVPKAKGGSNQTENLQLLHGHCHDQKHKKIRTRSLGAV